MYIFALHLKVETKQIDLNMVEIITLRVLIKDSIDQYEKLIPLFSFDIEEDFDYLMYYTLKINELKELLEKL